MKRLHLYAMGLCLALWFGAMPVARAETIRVRVATYNASLNRTTAGRLITDLQTSANTQARRVAEIVQRVRPDILLLNEFDYDAAGQAAALFQSNYLAVSQNGRPPIAFAHRFTAPVNTGVPAGLDFNNDGATNGPDDAYGFGAFPGQYGMVVYAQYPLDTGAVRTFQKFRWKDMPGALLPTVSGGTNYYATNELTVFRLSSKSHWDLPFQIGIERLHLLASHPAPPVFDGTEDRNGRRNHDEIRLWADYIDPWRQPYLYADQGGTNHLEPGARFIIAGDQNADPFDGDSTSNAIRQLLLHPLVQTNPTPASAGGAQYGAGAGQVGNPTNDTAAFNGGLRVDYVLPSRTLRVAGAGVFWPRTDQDGYSLISASDHRLVWLDVDMPGGLGGSLLIVR